MSKTDRKPVPTDPPSRDPSAAQPERSPYDRPGREPDPTEYYRQILKRLDELGGQLAEALGVPVEDVLGIRRVARTKPKPRRHAAPAKPELTPEQRAAREAAIQAFQALSQNSATLH